jgi:AcrR family transcriptional regulator
MVAMARQSDLTRPWRGVSPELRIVARRERILEAALQVFAARGFHASRVRDICSEAELTERYFYESFSGKDELLIVLVDQLVADFVAAAAPGIALVASDVDGGIRTAITAVVASLTDDPRRARILFVEVVGVSSEAEDHRRAVIGSLAAVIRGVAIQAFGEWAGESIEVELIARGAIGAASELIVSHVRGELVLDRDDLSRMVTTLFLAARQMVVAMVAGRGAAIAEHERQTA